MKPKSKLTMKDLAQELGLSVSVVSRVLNGKADDFRISEKTQILVRDTAAKRGFSVNQLARGLRLKKTSTIGLLIPDISNSFFSTIARSVENTARRRGYSIILCDTENNEEIEQQSLTLLHDRAVDGFLIAPVGKESQHIKAILDRGIPTVLIDRFFDTAPIPYITSNNYQGAYDGTTHLIDAGHHRIGFIQGIPNSKPNVERLRGYRQALKDRQIVFDSTLVQGNSFEEHDGYESTCHLLKLPERPSALFASSSVGALGAMRACLEMALQVPSDVSLVAFDEYPYAPLLSPPLTTIAQQTVSIGDAASQMLLDWVESGTPPDETSCVLDTTLVSRASVTQGPYYER